MMKKSYSDDEIIKAIRKGGNTANQMLEYLMFDSGYREGLIALMRQYNVNEFEHDDYFQDTLMRFFRNLKLGRFEGKSSLKTYFISIAKNIQKSRYSKGENRKKLLLLKPDDTGAAINQEEILILKEKEELLKQVFLQLGNICNIILSLSIAGYPTKDILEKSGYKSLSMLRKKKSQCKTKLKTFLSGRPELIKKLKGNE